MELELYRYKFTPYSTGGKLAIDGVFECYTLERAKTDPQFLPIPCGRYPVQMLESPHFNRIIPHILCVPGRTYIEIHMGNYPRDSEGCVIVGKELGTDAIWASTGTLDVLCTKLNASKDAIFITIQEVNNEETTDSSIAA